MRGRRGPATLRARTRTYAWPQRCPDHLGRRELVVRAVRCAPREPPQVSVDQYQLTNERKTRHSRRRNFDCATGSWLVPFLALAYTSSPAPRPLRRAGRYGWRRGSVHTVRGIFAPRSVGAGTVHRACEFLCARIRSAKVTVSVERRLAVIPRVAGRSTRTPRRAERRRHHPAAGKRGRRPGRWANTPRANHLKVRFFLVEFVDCHVDRSLWFGKSLV